MSWFFWLISQVTLQEGDWAVKPFLAGKWSYSIDCWHSTDSAEWALSRALGHWYQLCLIQWEPLSKVIEQYQHFSFSFMYNVILDASNREFRLDHLRMSEVSKESITEGLLKTHFLLHNFLLHKNEENSLLLCSTQCFLKDMSVKISQSSEVLLILVK